MEQTKSLLLDDHTLHMLRGNLKRIFSLKIVPSTLREVQNIILSCTENNQEQSALIFEALFSGAVPEMHNESHMEMFESMIQEFMVPLRLAKEILERGECINLVTSDLLTQQDRFAFLNRFRRVDGEEFVMISDTVNTLQLIRHFLSRLRELKDHPKGKDHLALYKKELQHIKEQLQDFC